MYSQFIFSLLMIVLLVVVLCVVFFVFLWGWKRKSDQRAYEEILGEPQVRTFYEPGGYRRTSDERERQQKDREERGE